MIYQLDRVVLNLRLSFYFVLFYPFDTENTFLEGCNYVVLLNDGVLKSRTVTIQKTSKNHLFLDLTPRVRIKR